MKRFLKFFLLTLLVTLYTIAIATYYHWTGYKKGLLQDREAQFTNPEDFHTTPYIPERKESQDATESTI